MKKAKELNAKEMEKVTGGQDIVVYDNIQTELIENPEADLRRIQRLSELHGASYIRTHILNS